MAFLISVWRRLVFPCVCITALMLLLRILTVPLVRSQFNFEATVASRFQVGIPISAYRFESADARPSSQTVSDTTKSVFNDRLIPFLSCSSKPNLVTNTIRLPILIHNISMTPPNTPDSSTLQFFNPTIIPLPSHSPFQYLLLSRLVTRGLHQESHICFATLCRSTNIRQAITTDSQPCDASDYDVLGTQGGLRCATPPQRLNIPPTPAYRCEGAWSAFPDIPGFHDPRMFWSGKEEPLVIVNSGSRYGCVGLWVVDLRAVYPDLEELLLRKGRYAAVESSQRIDVLNIELPARKSYPHLTEITKNPREIRNAVEKNWILFFPQADESWVQYDLVAHVQTGNGGNAHKQNLTASLATHVDDTVRFGANTSHEGNNISAIKMHLAGNDTNLKLHTSVTSSGLQSSVIRNGTDQTPNQETAHQRKSPPFYQDAGPFLTPSRSIAKIIGSGYTSSNITARDEAPCLTIEDLLDNRGNTGHWHQGSNSLRLILCTRQDLTCLGKYDEDELVQSGKIVHFAILHRKFSNDLDLPMRYERYVMVWEARFPFRMVGISQHPILFAGEHARPWNTKENELEDNDVETRRWEGVYFMYTPSLAWSWRKKKSMSDTGGLRTGLGTGFIGDDVLVGVGMDDTAQGFVKVKAEELLNCLRLCPGFRTKQ